MTLRLQPDPDPACPAELLERVAAWERRRDIELPAKRQAVADETARVRRLSVSELAGNAMPDRQAIALAAEADEFEYALALDAIPLSRDISRAHAELQRQARAEADRLRAEIEKALFDLGYHGGVHSPNRVGDMPDRHPRVAELRARARDLVTSAEPHVMQLEAHAKEIGLRLEQTRRRLLGNLAPVDEPEPRIVGGYQPPRPRLDQTDVDEEGRLTTAHRVPASTATRGFEARPAGPARVGVGGH
jgi:hypothetical protein